MQLDDYPHTISVSLGIDDAGEHQIFMHQEFEEGTNPELVMKYSDVMDGLAINIRHNMVLLSLTGAMARLLEEAGDEDEISFEPDDELLEAISASKIIPFNKKN